LYKVKRENKKDQGPNININESINSEDISIGVDPEGSKNGAPKNEH
jgi:hypothetical protein